MINDPSYLLLSITPRLVQLLRVGTFILTFHDNIITNLAFMCWIKDNMT